MPVADFILPLITRKAKTKNVYTVIYGRRKGIAGRQAP